MSRIGLDHRVAHREGVLFRNLDGEAVLVDLTSGTYYGLDPVGTRIWERIGGGARVDALLEAILEEYEVDPGTAKRDLLRLLGVLEGRRLIRVAASPAAPRGSRADR